MKLGLYRLAGEPSYTSSSTMSSITKWPGESDEAFPDTFSKPPPFPKTLKPGQLTKQQFDQFFQEGYVVVDRLFDDNEMQLLAECREDIAELVEQLAQKLYKAGKIKKLYKEYGFFQRLSQIEKEFPGANILLHKTGRLPAAFRKLWSHEKLLNISEQLLGTEDISGNPVWNLRTKTPRNEPTTVPWHQDNGYFSNDIYGHMVVTGWIPFIDATEFNGCMQMTKGGHRTGKTATHQCCHGNTWYVILEDDEMQNTLGVNMKEDVVTCPVPYGGVLLFSNIIPHRSLNNLSGDIRWSADLRWQKSSSPAGLFGLKDPIKFRSTSNKDMQIDWEPFDAIDRTKQQRSSLGLDTEDEFDTTLRGPWMKKWEIVHMNEHTHSFEKDQQADGMP